MRTWNLLLGLLALSLFLTGCAAEADDGVATLGNGASETPAPASGSAEVDPQEAMLDFAQCMRDEGIDMPDPKGEGAGIIVDRNSGIDPESPAFKAAEQKCRPILEEVMREAQGDVDPEEEARMQDAMLEFAQCMRDEGIDFPDPQMDGGVVRIGPGEGVDPGDPAVQAADEKCRALLPEAGVVREGGQP